MKNNTVYTLIITLALLLSNLTTVFADDGAAETPEPEHTKAGEKITAEPLKSEQPREKPDQPPAAVNHSPAKTSEPQDSKAGQTTTAEPVKPEEPQEKSDQSSAAANHGPAKTSEPQDTRAGETTTVEPEKKESKEKPADETKEQVQPRESEQEDALNIFQDNENTEEINLTNAEAPENLILGGDAEMTGDGETDSEGDGWLRLTGDESYELGYAVYDQALKTENGLAFKFDYTAWGGSGADGITFFLMDGETSIDEFNPGGYGGSLGYAPRYTMIDGLSNAVVGIGIDEFGNFSKASEGRSGGNGRTQDAVAVRGPGDGIEGYEFIEGTEKLEQGVDIRHIEERPDQTGEYYRNVSMMFTPVQQQFSLTLSMQFGAESKPEELFNDLLIPGIIPETVKFGFTGASGGATNIHEVRNLVVDKAVINDAAEQVKKTVANKKSSNNTVSVPVTAVQTGGTLTVIPVTGSDHYPLSCEVQTKLDVKDQVYAILPALCGQEASLVLEKIDTIPFALPDSYTLLNASTLAIIDGATFEAYAADGEQIEVGFYLEADQAADNNLTILVWQDGQWLEQEVLISDGAISTTVAEGALLVLVQK